MTDAPPSSTDEAAVEATRQITPNLSADAIARSITDAYTKTDRRALAQAAYASVVARLTAEREVREQLIANMPGCENCCNVMDEPPCSRCVVLAAAEKLDKCR